MDDISALLARQSVVEAVTRLFVHTDERDWAKVRSCFADHVLFDMKSMSGDEPTLLPADEIVSSWKDGLDPLQALHHQVGNFLVDVHDTTAEAFCYGTASHYLPNPTGENTRIFVGNYDFGLTLTAGRWVIDKFKFNLKYIDGNPDLEATLEDS